MLSWSQPPIDPVRAAKDATMCVWPLRGAQNGAPPPGGLRVPQSGCWGSAVYSIAIMIVIVCCQTVAWERPQWGAVYEGETMRADLTTCLAGHDLGGLS